MKGSTIWNYIATGETESKKLLRLKDTRGFAEYFRNDRKAVEQACCTCFDNGLLEGTVNKTKAIKRSMYNRAKADVLRAKLLYGNVKWDGNYHLN